MEAAERRSQRIHDDHTAINHFSQARQWRGQPQLDGAEWASAH